LKEEETRIQLKSFEERRTKGLLFSVLLLLFYIYYFLKSILKLLFFWNFLIFLLKVFYCSISLNFNSCDLSQVILLFNFSFIYLFNYCLIIVKLKFFFDFVFFFCFFGIFCFVYYSSTFLLLFWLAPRISQHVFITNKIVIGSFSKKSGVHHFFIFFLSLDRTIETKGANFIIFFVDFFSLTAISISQKQKKQWNTSFF